MARSLATYPESSETLCKPGERVGRYQFLREVTKSPLGALWEARLEGDKELVQALARVINISDADGETEDTLAQAAWDSMELYDDGLLRVADIIFEKGWLVLVHDHSDGDPLSSILRRVKERRSALPIPVALRVVMDTARAVQACLDQGQELDLPYHGVAIDPGSVFVCADGIARLLDGYVGAQLAFNAASLRSRQTPSYAAPEQFNLPPSMNARSVVFSLGLLTWELLAGRPFNSGSQREIQRRLRGKVPRVDGLTRPGMRPTSSIADALEVALELDAAKRYESPGAFADALKKAADAIAKPDEVIQFVDALSGRESTLARLLMIKPLKLSERIKSVRPPRALPARPPRLPKPGKGPGESPTKRAPARPKGKTLLGLPNAVTTSSKPKVVGGQTEKSGLSPPLPLKRIEGTPELKSSVVASAQSEIDDEDDPTTEFTRGSKLIQDALARAQEGERKTQPFDAAAPEATTQAGPDAAFIASNRTLPFGFTLSEAEKKLVQTPESGISPESTTRPQPPPLPDASAQQAEESATVPIGKRPVSRVQTPPGGKPVEAPAVEEPTPTTKQSRASRSQGYLVPLLALFFAGTSTVLAIVVILLLTREDPGDVEQSDATAPSAAAAKEPAAAEPPQAETNTETTAEVKANPDTGAAAEPDDAVDAAEIASEEQTDTEVPDGITISEESNPASKAPVVYRRPRATRRRPSRKVDKKYVPSGL